jgi:uncharacterized SAM-dependent methyltransferase
MSQSVNVVIHWSQFPDRVRHDLIESLRTRQVNHKFHYDSVRQTQKWLALHQAYSPSRTDADCAATYDRGFAATASRMEAKQVHVVGLGCGGGQKDARLLKLLQAKGKDVSYTPTDVSTAMVLVARQTTEGIVSPGNCFPMVCDLALADDLPAEIAEREPAGRARLITFFGMIPNFEPRLILNRLSGLVRRQDYLLFSANLAPGPDYEVGVKRILPLYDNALTRDWLITFLLDLGVEQSDGEIRFGIDEDPGTRLKRVSAHFHFSRSRTVQVEDQRFEFQAGDSIRLFFSYRHTPELVRGLFARHGLKVVDQWITRSGEEGVFLVKSE